MYYKSLIIKKKMVILFLIYKKQFCRLKLRSNQNCKETIVASQITCFLQCWTLVTSLEWQRYFSRYKGSNCRCHLNCLEIMSFFIVSFFLSISLTNKTRVRISSEVTFFFIYDTLLLLRSGNKNSNKK